MLNFTGVVDGYMRSQENLAFPPSVIPGLMVVLTTCLETLRDVETSSRRSKYESRPTRMNKDRTVADELAKRVRVLCWVMTHPANHHEKARNVKATWGKRCNKLLFMSTQEDTFLPTVKLPTREGRAFLWGKTKAAFRYVYEHHRNDADWFLKADDDTYVVIENLRYMLSKYNTSDPTYFGRRLKGYSQGFMTGGAGYVLSREALDRFVVTGLRSPNLCYKGDKGAEDTKMSTCLNNIGVRAMDDRDSSGRGRFFQYAPKEFLVPSNNRWRYNLYYPSDEGISCCSDHAVSYHYVNPKSMYLYDYLIYHVKPYGIRYGVDAETKGDMKPTTMTTTNEGATTLPGSDHSHWERPMPSSGLTWTDDNELYDLWQPTISKRRPRKT